MANNIGTLVTAQIRPQADGDPIATALANDIQGGWHQVTSISDRDAIISARKVNGMACFVTDVSASYIWGDTGWTLNSSQAAFDPSSYTLLSITTSISGDLQQQITLNGYPKAKTGYSQETIVTLGDSWTGRTLLRVNLSPAPSLLVTSPNDVGFEGYMGWANAILDNRFRIIEDMGASGDTLGEMYGRVVNGYDVATLDGTSQDYALPHTIPSLSVLLPDWLFIFGGINDISSGGQASTMITTWQNIYNYAVSLGVKVATATLPLVAPSGTPWTASQKRQAITFNRFLRQFCKENGVPCADFNLAYTDPTTEQMVTSYTSDSLHPNLLGGIIGGLELAKAFKNTNSIYQERLPPIRDARRLNLNNRLIGANAANTNGFRNFITLADIDGPTGTYVEQLGSGTLTNLVTVSKVARTDGYPGEVTRINFDGTTATSNSSRVAITQEVREASWSSGGAVNPSSGSSGNLYTHRVVTTTGRAASTPVDYLVTNFGGTFAVGSDPTASWSTTIGDIITDGTVTMRVVNAIIAGTTAIRFKSVFSNYTLTAGSGTHIHNQLVFRNSSGTVLGENNFFRYEAGSTLPNVANYIQSSVYETPAVVIPATTARYAIQFVIWVNSGSIGYVDLEALDCYIAEPEGDVP